METEEILAAIQKAADTIATPNLAAWLSAGAALVAVAVAIVVAVMQIKIARKQNKIISKQTKISNRQVEISNRQNQIALFEKRYEVYCELFKIIGIGYQLDRLEPHSKFSFFHEVEVIYDVNFSGKDFNAKLVTILTRIKRSEYIVKQSAFLFYCIDEADIYILIESLMDCMVYIIKDDSKEVDIENNDVKKFIEICRSFSSKYLSSIKAELSLK